MKTVTRFFTQNLILVAIISIAFITLISAISAAVNVREMERSTLLKQQALFIKDNTSGIIGGVVHRLDLAVRGYGVTQNENLLEPFQYAELDFAKIFTELDSLLSLEGHEGFRTGAQELKTSVGNYIKWCREMVAVTREGNIDQLKAMMEEDRGLYLWYDFDRYTQGLYGHLNQFIAKADHDYNLAVQRNLFIQIGLAVIALPTLIAIVLRLRSDRRERARLLQVLVDNNNKYLFDPLDNAMVSGTQEVVDSSIKTFIQINDFVNKISNGDYGADWEGMTTENGKCNESTVAGNLLRMKARLIQLKEADEQRNWVNEGLARFSELLRRHQTNAQVLNDEVMRFLVKHLKAQQGSLFIVDEVAEQLQLASCFAFDKKKYLTKSVAFGEGTLGQAYLEKSTILLKEVPADYIKITSGLGEARPRCVLLVAVKQNDIVEGVIEIASFRVFSIHEIEFAEKCAEFFATALRMSKTTVQMEKLLLQSQEQSGALKMQEESMRQNFEELQATQEEMQRKAREMEQRMQVLDASGILFAEISMDGYWLSANRAFSDVTKFTERQLKSMAVSHLPEMPWHRDDWKSLRAEEAHFGVFKLRRANGSELEIQGSISMIQSAGGSAAKLVLVATVMGSETAVLKS